jgi:hypothetical protein
VPNAEAYEFVLRDKGYGRDILHLVSDNALVDLGLLPGDVIRMKAGCAAWWSSPDAKRKWDEEGPDSPGNIRTSPNKKVCYERRYTHGGLATFFGPTLVPGRLRLVDAEMFYFCPVREMMVPVPAGFTVIEDDDSDPFNVSNYPE